MNSSSLCQQLGCHYYWIVQYVVQTVYRKETVYSLGIRDTVFTRLNAAAFIKFLAFPMRRLLKGGVYSRAAFISKSYFLNH